MRALNKIGTASLEPLARLREAHKPSELSFVADMAIDQIRDHDQLPGESVGEHVVDDAGR